MKHGAKERRGIGLNPMCETVREEGEDGSGKLEAFLPSLHS